MLKFSPQEQPKFSNPRDAAIARYKKEQSLKAKLEAVQKRRTEHEKLKASTLNSSGADAKSSSGSGGGKDKGKDSDQSDLDDIERDLTLALIDQALFDVEKNLKFYAEEMQLLAHGERMREQEKQQAERLKQQGKAVGSTAEAAAVARAPVSWRDRWLLDLTCHCMFAERWQAVGLDH